VYSKKDVELDYEHCSVISVVNPIKAILYRKCQIRGNYTVFGKEHKTGLKILHFKRLMKVY
jgi:hypothetical protein